MLLLTICFLSSNKPSCNISSWSNPSGGILSIGNQSALVVVPVSLKTLTLVLNIFINELYDTFDISKEMRMYDFITTHAKQGLKIEEDKEISLNDREFWY